MNVDELMVDGPEEDLRGYDGSDRSWGESIAQERVRIAKLCAREHVEIPRRLSITVALNWHEAKTAKLWLQVEPLRHDRAEWFGRAVHFINAGVTIHGYEAGLPGEVCLLAFRHWLRSVQTSIAPTIEPRSIATPRTDPRKSTSAQAPELSVPQRIAGGEPSLEWLDAALAARTEEQAESVYRPFFRGIRELIKSERYSEVSRCLNLLAAHAISIDPLLPITGLRLTALHRRHITDWDGCRESISAALKQREYDPNDLLRGLD